MAYCGESAADGFGGIPVGEADDADAKKRFAAALNGLYAGGEFLLAEPGGHFARARLVAERAELNDKRRGFAVFGFRRFGRGIFGVGVGGVLADVSERGQVLGVGAGQDAKNPVLSFLDGGVKSVAAQPPRHLFRAFGVAKRAHLELIFGNGIRAFIPRGFGGGVGIRVGSGRRLGIVVGRFGVRIFRLRRRGLVGGRGGVGGVGGIRIEIGGVGGGAGRGDVLELGLRGLGLDLDEVFAGELGVDESAAGDIGGGEVVAELPQQDGDGEDACGADEAMADPGDGVFGRGREQRAKNPPQGGARNGVVVGRGRRGRFFGRFEVGHGDGCDGGWGWGGKCQQGGILPFFPHFPLAREITPGLPGCRRFLPQKFQRRAADSVVDFSVRPDDFAVDQSHPHPPAKNAAVKGRPAAFAQDFPVPRCFWRIVHNRQVGPKSLANAPPSRDGEHFGRSSRGGPGNIRHCERSGAFQLQQGGQGKLRQRHSRRRVAVLRPLFGQ